jgi:homoserine kinase
MKSERLVIKAPASSANLGPGFDTFGLALSEPYDLVEVCAEEKGVSIELKGVEADTIPQDPSKNSAGLVALEVIKRHRVSHGVALRITKGVKPGAGLGSSAASAAATAYGLNQLFKLGLEPNEIVALAAKGEVASAGVEHADNVSASILGGFTFVVSFDPFYAVSIKPPSKLELCVSTPKLDVEQKKTQRLRAVVPKRVAMRDVVWNVSHAAAVSAGFALGDIELICRGIHDVIVEKARSPLIPCYNIVKKNALEAGAKGVAVSGAGPSMIAFVERGTVCSVQVVKSMIEAYEEAGFEAEGFVTEPGGGCAVVGKS